MGFGTIIKAITQIQKKTRFQLLRGKYLEQLVIRNNTIKRSIGQSEYNIPHRCLSLYSEKIT